MRILAIVGSLREGSLNRQLAEAAGKELSAVDPQAEFAILDWADVPLFNQDIEVPAPEPVSRVRREVLGADGIWVFTPEYNHFFPGTLKNLLDWLSRPVGAGQGQAARGERRLRGRHGHRVRAGPPGDARLVPQHARDEQAASHHPPRL